MKKTALTLAFVAVALVFPSTHASAQDLTRFSVEGRFGVLGVPSGGFLEVGKGNHFTLGFLVAYRPMAESFSFLDRITGRFSFDGSGIGGQDVAAGIKNKERVYLVNFAAGFDVVQMPRFSAIIHAGAAISRDHFVIQEYSPFGGAFGTGGYVSACSYAPGACQSIWNFLGNEGVEARFVPKESWTFFFVGVDYTHFAGAKNQTMFTAGLQF